MDNGKCVILIILNSIKLSDFRETSLKNTFNKLNNYDIYAVCSKDLDISYYKEHFNFIKYIRLSQYNFDDINKLYMNKKIYEFFNNDYEYIIIMDTNTWILNNNLQSFIDKKYNIFGQLQTSFTIDNYCGDQSSYIIYRIHNELNKTNLYENNLALRKISWMLDNLNKYNYNDDNPQYILDTTINTKNYSDLFVFYNFDNNDVIDNFDTLSYCVSSWNFWFWIGLNEYQLPFALVNINILDKDSLSCLQNNFNELIGYTTDDLQ